MEERREHMSKARKHGSRTKSSKDQARRPDDLENLFPSLLHGNLFTVFWGKRACGALSRLHRQHLIYTKGRTHLRGGRQEKFFQNRLKLSIASHKRAIREKCEHKNRRNYVPTCMLSTKTRLTQELRIVSHRKRKLPVSYPWRLR